jgi:hypothetical protein
VYNYNYYIKLYSMTPEEIAKRHVGSERWYMGFGGAAFLLAVAGLDYLFGDIDSYTDAIKLPLAFVVGALAGKGLHMFATREHIAGQRVRQPI